MCYNISTSKYLLNLLETPINIQSLLSHRVFKAHRQKNEPSEIHQWQRQGCKWYNALDLPCYCPLPTLPLHLPLAVPHSPDWMMSERMFQQMFQRKWRQKVRSVVGFLPVDNVSINVKCNVGRGGMRMGEGIYMSTVLINAIFKSASAFEWQLKMG